MQIINKEAYEILLEKYYDSLEQQGVDYLEHQDNGFDGQSHIEFFIKTEYQSPSVREICEHLGLDEWIIDYTEDLIYGQVSTDFALSKLELYMETI